ncbi:MAG: SpoIIE family protein phosphatase [Bacteroidetes bacterium]|nr:SpoIIE family protein phosphatase [Bacteroidota bacterium]
MFKKIGLLLIIVQFLWTPLSGQTIISAPREANFVNYTTEHGLDYVNGFRVFEDKKGYLWFCTKEGLSRFDGITFRNFTVADGLPSPIVTGACQDNNGNVWISTVKGLAIFKNNRFDTVPNLKRIQCINLIKANDGTIWAAGGDGLTHIDPLNKEKPLMKNYILGEKVANKAFRNLWQNKKGEIMGGGESGCFIIKNDSLVRYNDLPGPVYTMLEFEDGTEWFTGWDRPLSIYKNGKLEKEIKLGSFALDMLRDAKGNIWLATWDKGIFKYNGTDFINYSAKEGLAFNSFWGIDEDSGGNLWLSSWGRGLFKYSGESFTRLSDKSGLPSNNITGVVEGEQNKIWISSEQSVSSYNTVTGEINNITKCDGKDLSLVISLYADKPKEIWALGYIGQGYKIIEDKIIADKNMIGFSANKDSQGNIWIGTDKNGALKITGNDSRFINVSGVQPTNRVISVTEDTKHNYWLINEHKGILFYKNDVVKSFNRSNGFLNEPATAIAEDSFGFYWIAVPTKGVYKCALDKSDNIRIVDSLVASCGLISNNVRSVAAVNNKLYMGTKFGLCIMDLNLYEKGTKKLSYYNKEDGLLNPDCNLATFDSKGNLWLATSGGIYAFNAAQTNANTKETKTYITQMYLFFKEVDWLQYSKEYDDNGLPKNLSLNYQQNHLTFKFIGINLSAPTKVFYQYKLEGLDKDWSPEINKREADYSSIPPGTYTFMVKSCNNDGLWNKEPQTFVFTITPPFWKTGWFYAICTFVLLLGFYLFVKSRERKLQRQKVVLEQKVDQRTHQLKLAFEQIGVKNKEITDSINYASKIQAALLPSQEDIKLLAKDFFILFKPKDIVSGDFYWAEQKENKFYLAICDSTGHGVPGAFMSLLNLNFINEAVNEKNISKPNEIFNYVRNELISGISKEGQNDGFDGTLVCFDKANNTFTYTAANTKPILISNHTIKILPADKMPVGKGEKDESFTLHEVDYKAGDTLYLFTDGYADQFGGSNGKKMKFKKLEEIVSSIYYLTMEEQSKILNQKFNEWKGSLEQVDDVCLIGIRL